MGGQMGRETDERKASLTLGHARRPSCDAAAAAAGHRESKRHYDACASLRLRG